MGAAAGAPPAGTSAAAANAAAAAVARLQAQVRAARERAMSVAQIDAVRSLADWAVYGAAYLVTGNLFASFVGSAVTDGAFSAYQRLGVARLRKAERAKWDTATAQLRAKAAAALAAAGEKQEGDGAEGGAEAAAAKPEEPKADTER